MQSGCLRLALVLLLAGCARMPQYVAPAAGNTATVIFANQMPHKAFVRHYAVPQDCREPSDLPDIETRGEFQIPVAAGGEWAFAFGAGDEKENCVVVGSFRPEMGASYRATLRSSAGGCILSMVRLSDNTRVAFQPKVLSSPYNSTNNSACLPAQT